VRVGLGYSVENVENALTNVRCDFGSLLLHEIQTGWHLHLRAMKNHARGEAA
jgi:hypothetical protein